MLMIIAKAQHSSKRTIRWFHGQSPFTAKQPSTEQSSDNGCTQERRCCQEHHHSFIRSEPECSEMCRDKKTCQPRIVQMDAVEDCKDLGKGWKEDSEMR